MALIIMIDSITTLSIMDFNTNDIHHKSSVITQSFVAGKLECMKSVPSTLK